jgi:hypothetical protein
MQSSHLSRQTKFTIHKTLIRSVLLYGSGTWLLTKRRTNCWYWKEEGSPNNMRPENRKWCLQEKAQPRTRLRVGQPECPKCHKDKQIALRWTHDQKTRRSTTKNSIQNQTQWKEKSRKTEIQVGRC